MTKPVKWIFLLILAAIHMQCSPITAFYFNSAIFDNRQQQSKILLPFGSLVMPIELNARSSIRTSADGAGKSMDEVDKAAEEIHKPPGDLSKSVDGLSEPGKRRIVDMFQHSTNVSQEPNLKCDEVLNEMYRCCRVYDNMVEAWWCPSRLPFCCHQGTACATCCTVDEARRLERHRQRGLADCGRRSAGIRPPLGAPVDDESWFWNGMKAAWLTMVGVILVSLCCTCIAHKCITYLVSIVDDDDDDQEEEYLAHHFNGLSLVDGEITSPGRQTTAGHGQLPPKYSDINFLPGPPETTISVPAPSEPPPVYSSDLEADPVETTTTPDTASTNHNQA